MALKEIRTSTNRINYAPAKRMISISATISELDERFKIKVETRKEDCVTPRKESLIVVDFPNGEKWEGTISQLQKKMVKKKKVPVA